jgi:hypothetical protein
VTLFCRGELTTPAVQADLVNEIANAPQPPALSDERILHHLDAILKASGSGLKNYSMHKPIEEMKQAIRAIEREILGENNESN